MSSPLSRAVAPFPAPVCRPLPPPPWYGPSARDWWLLVEKLKASQKMRRFFGLNCITNSVAIPVFYAIFLGIYPAHCRRNSLNHCTANTPSEDLCPEGDGNAVPPISLFPPFSLFSNISIFLISLYFLIFIFLIFPFPRFPPIPPHLCVAGFLFVVLNTQNHIWGGGCLR